jgi:hypothetical protein
MKLVYLCDRKRHLVCIPYSGHNLHQMAKELGIKRCWFHRNHYDIPKRRVEEILERCEIVSMRKILKIINNYDLDK